MAGQVGLIPAGGYVEEIIYMSDGTCTVKYYDASGAEVPAADVKAKLEAGDLKECCCEGEEPKRALKGTVEELAFDATAPVALTPPADATHAEIQVDGGAIRFYPEGTTPNPTTGYKLHDCGWLELESAEEVAGFLAIGQPGQSGTLRVTYFCQSNANA